jgi:hypothetical protein
MIGDDVLAVGDTVEVVSLPARAPKGLAVGQRGTVVCELGWAVTIEVGAKAQAYLVRRSHLQLRARPECEHGGGNSDGTAANRAPGAASLAPGA